MGLRFQQTEKRKSSGELSSHALKNAHPRKRARRKALPKAPPFSRSKNAHRAIAILWDPQARRDPQAAALVPRSHRHCCLLVFFCFLPPIRLSAAPVVLTPALCLLLVAVWRQLPLTLQPRAAERDLEISPATVAVWARSSLLIAGWSSLCAS